MLFSIKKLTSHSFSTFHEEFVELYLHSFTTGEYAQYISRKEAEERLNELQITGSGYYAIYYGKLVGAVFGIPFSLDKEFPVDLHPEIRMDKTIYIAEVIVHSEVRGRGVASTLIAKLLKEAESDNFTDAVIRVWDSNIPALTLYKKLGFTETEEITQIKQETESVTFEMRKIYLHKKLK
ncbi:MAG: GNAT family N-acetyltransferase [Paludibacteraceae bacterium]